MNTTSKLIKNEALDIFRNFLIRDNGFTEKEAAMEIAEFITSNGVVVTKDFYLTVRRTGSTKTLTRAQRASVYASLENAFNHATF